MPFVHTPHLLVASQFDSYQLAVDTGETSLPLSKQALAFALRFQNLTRSSLASLAGLHNSTQTSSDYAYYSDACLNHAVSVSAGGAFSRSKTSSGVSRQAALSLFIADVLEGRSGDKRGRSWVDGCTDVTRGPCGSGCWP